MAIGSMDAARPLGSSAAIAQIRGGAPCTVERRGNEGGDRRWMLVAALAC
jgi:hypothetical protein